MLTNVLLTLVVLALTGTILWLTWRARQLEQPVGKWSAIVVGSLFSLILLVLSGASTRGLGVVYAARGRALNTFSTVERTPERVARGQHIAETLCAGCHTMNNQLPLSGGKNLSEEAHMPLGDLFTINLTPAGPLKDWSDPEIFRALRDGADKNRNRLLVMSSQHVRNLSDDDIKSVIAYLRSQPPVDHETPPPRPSLLTVMMAGAGLLPILPGMAPEHIEHPTPGPTAEYGQYIVNWYGCEECHGVGLNGGGGGVIPTAPTLRTVKGWTREGFITTLRTGKTPFGKQLDSLKMPYNMVGRMTDDELTAVYKYLNTLP